MKAAIMAKGEEAGKSEMQLPPDPVIFGFGDAPE